jgi:hypothetical protein
MPRRPRLKSQSFCLFCHDPALILYPSVSSLSSHLFSSPKLTSLPKTRSFYNLSKTHHPDHNPDDPTSHARFTRLTEAYATLSHADQRARYDRDHLHLTTAHQHHAARRSGSYSSTGPGQAGGRAPSGLSKRRGTFTGPPPSFYRSGGWGAQGSKRRAAHEETTGTAGPMGGGMGPGQDPTHNTAGAAHFDHVGHERMHRRYEESRRARRRGEEGVPVVDTGLWFRFVVVTAIVAGAAYVPYWFSRGEGRKTRKREV